MQTMTQNIKVGSPWRVSAVQVKPNFCLEVKFLDGTQGIVDLSHRVHSANAGVFSSLADEAQFKQVHVSFGAVTWPNEIDLAPDAMYDAIKANGQWILTE